MDADGKQLVTADGTSEGIELGSGGSELIIKTVNENKVSTKAIGSREYLRYYRQKPRPSPDGVPITAVLAARLEHTFNDKDEIRAFMSFWVEQKIAIFLLVQTQYKRGTKSCSFCPITKNSTRPSVLSCGDRTVGLVQTQWDKFCVAIFVPLPKDRTRLSVLSCLVVLFTQDWFCCNLGRNVKMCRYRSMGLSTVQSKENMVRMKVMKQMNRSGVDFMRSKMGMKSNVIRNLPNNVTY